MESSCEAVSELSDTEKLKKNLFLLFLDTMIAEMNQCFSSVNIKILEGVQACYPKSASLAWQVITRLSWNQRRFLWQKLPKRDAPIR